MGVVDLIVAGLAVALLALVAITIGFVARDRPPQPRRSRRDRVRPSARTMRGWQARTLREVRRSGRPPSHRPRRDR